MMASGHGWPKFQEFASKKESFPVPEWFSSFMTSEIALITAIITELLGGALISLGLLTRPFALLLALTMLTAAFSVHANDPLFAVGGPSKEMALLYLVPCLVILLVGAGKYSVDRIIPN